MIPSENDGRHLQEKMHLSGTRRPGNGQSIVKVLSAYNAYNMIMSAVKRIPVSEPLWKKLGEMKGAGQTYDDLLLDMIERVQKARLEEDVKIWESRQDSEYVSLSEIKD